MRKLALRIFTEWETEGKYINLAIGSHTLDSLTAKEKSALTALLYTTVEKKITYDYYISSISKRSVDKIDPVTLNILRLGVCQIVDMDSVPDFAAVNESVKLARNPGERSFINGVLREISRKRESGELPLPPYEKNPARHFSVKYSLPLWIVKSFLSELSEEEAILLFESFTKERPLSVSVNTTKISREDFLSELRLRGISAFASEISPLTVKIEDKCKPTELFGFEEGLFFVQDEASCLAALALAPKKNERVIDVCSAPGGKSFASAILMENEGVVLSREKRESKLSLIESGKERLGLSIIKTESADSTNADEGLFCAFDKLICDVPCSGLGVISKKSDLRYKDEESVSALPELQYAILSASAKYLKAGGVGIYSTCTLNKKENEEVFRRFLENNEDFTFEDFKVSGLESVGGTLTLYPHKNGTDGFFIAKLRKKQ